MTSRSRKDALRGILHGLGIEVVRYLPRNFLHLRRAELLRSGAISLVLDVGAGDGSWALQLRRAGFRGRLVSVEPLTESYAQLQARCCADPGWEAFHVALGDREGTADLYVAGTAQSSSLLPMAARHVEAAPGTAVVGTETVAVTRLDSLGVVHEHGRTYLKLDVQGAELQVLHGATSTLRATEAVEAELSLVELYEGQALLPDVVTELARANFRFVAMEPSFRDPRTGDLLQVNGLFRP